jgi:transposase-like protein
MRRAGDGSCPALSALQPNLAARDEGRVAFTRLREWRAHWQRDGGETGDGLVVTGAGPEEVAELAVALAASLHALHGLPHSRQR